MGGHVVDGQAQAGKERTNVRREERQAFMVDDYRGEEDLSRAQISGERINRRAWQSVSVDARALRQKIDATAEMVFENWPELTKWDQATLHTGESAVDPCILVCNRLNDKGRSSISSKSIASAECLAARSNIAQYSSGAAGTAANGSDVTPLRSVMNM